MKLTDIAFSNLKVRRTKMLFLLLGMVIGVATIVALSGITSSMETGLNQHFARQGVRMLLAPQSEQFSISYSGIPVTSELVFDSPYIPATVVGQLKQLQSIGAISPKLVVPVELAGKKRLLVGIEPSAEKSLNPWWQLAEGQLPGDKAVLLGSEIADSLNKKVGGTVEILGNTFTIAGKLRETGQVDDKLLFMPLETAAGLTQKDGSLSMVEFNLPGMETGTAASKAAIEKLKSMFPDGQVTEVKGQQEARREVVNRFKSFAALVSVIVFIIGCLIIMSTMLSSVNERTSEIGVFRAIGFRQKHVARIILTEAALISLAAGIIGYLLGMSAVLLVMPLLSRMDFQAALQWHPLFALLVIFAATAVGLLSSFYPAWHAAKLDPAEALRHF